MTAALLVKFVGTSVLLLIVVVLGLFFPIAAFVHSIRNPTLSRGAKIGWACLILFTYPLGATIYGIFASGRPLFKFLGILSLIVIVPFIFARNPLGTYAAKQEKSLVIRHLDNIHQNDFGDADRAILKSEIESLDPTKKVTLDLLVLLYEMIRTGHLDRGQLMDWQRFYQSKDILDKTEITKYKLKLQLNNMRNR